MNSLVDLIINEVKKAVNVAYPNLSDQPIEVTAATNISFGHYQCNNAMRFAKILTQNPKIIAANIVSNMSRDIFAEISIAGAGFINITVADWFLEKNVDLFLNSKKFLWNEAQEQPNKRTVVIDFSSPNIAKDMHVGHLRSTIIGDCLARILEFLQYKVIRINHVGDWGTQFGMLIAYLKYHNKLADLLLAHDLVVYYQQAKQLFDADANFKKIAQQEVVSLQSGNAASIAIWNNICEISKKAYLEIYELLDIKITDRGESFYNSMLSQIIEDFKQQSLLTESQGAKCIYLDGFVNREQQPLPLIVQKADGGYNYATTDLAAIKYRVKQDRANWLIYVTDSGQALHFAMIFAAAKKVGYLSDKININHVPFGLVLRSDGKKFKTREGKTEKLKDLISKSIDKARQLVLTRNADLSKSEIAEISFIMGVNAIKYADLANNRNSDYIFDYDKMLQFTGNTAAFLSYAYVRINSIKHKIGINNIAELLDAGKKIKITEQPERNLALRICRLQDTINAVVTNLMPNRLTDYLYSLAEEFHEFFHACRVEGTELQDSRILLCQAVANVLELGFNLLGLKKVNKM